MELNFSKLINLNSPNHKDPYSLIIPSYLRNVNTVLEAKFEIEKVSWDKEGEDLINETKISLTKEEKRILKYLIMKGVPDNKRGQMWLISSGAKKEMVNNPGYYESLINNYLEDVELPSDHQINLDINRTFPEDPYFENPETLQKLKKVLLAYSRRNISIGYVQGFNFIAGRLLKIIHNEEEVFWIFTQIIEQVLPLNFYSEMAGLMIDVDILLYLINNFFPDFIKFLDGNFFVEYFKNILFQWFVSLFIQNFSYEAGLLIWDVLFIDRNVVLFKTAIGLIKYLLNNLMKVDTLEAFKTCIKECFCKFNDVNYLKYYIIMRKYEFNTEILDKNRIFLERTTKEQISIINTTRKNKLKDKVCKSTEECCDEWPICIYDYDSYYNVLDVLVYKVGTPIIFIEDYFEQIYMRQNTHNKKKLKKLKYENILIERKHHVCKNDKRRIKSKISSEGISVMFDKINDMDYDDIMNISTGTGDKSFDVTPDKSFDQDNNEQDSGDKKYNNMDKYEKTLKKYKHLRKNKFRMASLNNFAHEVKKNKEDKDFQAFVSKINIKYNKLSQANSFYLKDFDFKKLQKGSNDI